MLLTGRDRLIFNESFTKTAFYGSNCDFCLLEEPFSHLKDKKKYSAMAVLSGLYNTGGGCLFNGFKKQTNGDIQVAGITLKDSSAQESYVKDLKGELSSAFSGLSSESSFKIDLVPVVEKLEDTRVFQNKFVVRIAVAPLEKSQAPVASFDFSCECFDDSHNGIYSMKWTNGKTTSLTSKDFLSIVASGNTGKPRMSLSDLKDPVVLGASEVKVAKAGGLNNHLLDCIQGKETKPLVVESPGEAGPSNNGKSNQYTESLPKSGFREKSNSVFLPAQPVQAALLAGKAQQEKLNEQRKLSDASKFNVEAKESKVCDLEPVARSEEKVPMIPTESVNIKDRIGQFGNKPAEQPVFARGVIRVL